jgi:sulfite reductase beta subunit-like hemoprotein
MLSLSEILNILRSVFRQFALEKLSGETFGDFCFRTGGERLGASIDRLVG